MLRFMEVDSTEASSVDQATPSLPKKEKISSGDFSMDAEMPQTVSISRQSGSQLFEEESGFFVESSNTSNPTVVIRDVAESSLKPYCSFELALQETECLAVLDSSGENNVDGLINTEPELFFPTLTNNNDGGEELKKLMFVNSSKIPKVEFCDEDIAGLF